MNEAYQQLVRILNFGLPTTINALLILCIGVFVSFWVRSLFEGFLVSIQFPQALERIGWNATIYRYKSLTDVKKIFGTIIQFFVIALFLMIATELWHLPIFSEVLKSIVTYYPNIFVSLLIFILCIYLIDMAQKTVLGTRFGNSVRYSKIVGKSTDWFIRILAVLAILYQLQIVPQLIMVLFAGVICTFAIAIGLGLGLASKDAFTRLLSDIKKMFD